MFRTVPGPATRSAAIVFLGVLAAGWAGAQEVTSASHATLDEAVARVKPALVRIHVVSTEYEEGREMKMEGSGSGVIITKEGHVVTNHHVAGHAVRLFCTLPDRRDVDAELVGTDPLTDISVIKLKPETPAEFQPAVFGDSSAIRVGDTVLAMGSPLALSQSVTSGIVSNAEMIMPEWLRRWGEMKEDGEDVGALVKWIGHDARIFPGNSGGPLVNLRGEIVGINEISMGLGGAIPGNLVKSVADQLVAGGKITRAWLGVTVQPRLKHAKEDRGVLVDTVMSGSPAASAGIQSGDFVLRVNGKETNARFAEEIPDFNRVVADLPLGSPAEIVVMREGKEVALQVIPVIRERAKEKEQEIKEWGITVSNVSLMDAKEMKRKSQDGVLVTSVRPGGPAGEAKPGIAEKDIIVEANGKPASSVKQLLEITHEVLQGKTDPVPVLVAFERKTERFMTVAKVGIKELEDPGLEVKKAWLPCETQVITRTIAELLGKTDLTGFRVTEVYPDTTAQKAGLQVGDLIVKVDDEKLTASAPEHYEELATLIRQYKAGDSVKLAVLRGKEELTLPTELVLAPKLTREMKEFRDEQFEFTVREISFFDKAKEQWKEDQTGVLVSELKPGGWAALGHLNVGDLILAVDRASVADVKAFQAKMHEIVGARPQSVTLQVLRGIYTLYIELEPKWEDKP